MHSKVVYRAARAARDSGIPTLRLDFRGVGGSAGAFDGGRGEAEDAESAFSFLAERFPGRRLVAGGYSFGAWVGVRVGNAMPAVDTLIAIGTPTTVYGVDYLATVAKPILFVQGTADPIGPIAAVEAAAQKLGARARVVRIEGANHLFAGREDEVYAAVREFLLALDHSASAAGGAVE
jgi:alpha/beta superfamily hydrolase